MTFKRILSFTHQQISVEVHFVAKSCSVHCAPTWVLFLIYAPQVQSANIPCELLRAATGAADLTRTRTNCKSNWVFSRLCVAKEFVSGNRHICSNMELPVMPREAVPEISNGKVYIYKAEEKCAHRNCVCDMFEHFALRATLFSNTLPLGEFRELLETIAAEEQCKQHDGYSRRSQNHTPYRSQSYHNVSPLPQRHVPTFNWIKDCIIL